MLSITANMTLNNSSKYCVLQRFLVDLQCCYYDNCSLLKYVTYSKYNKLYLIFLFYYIFAYNSLYYISLYIFLCRYIIGFIKINLIFMLIFMYTYIVLKNTFVCTLFRKYFNILLTYRQIIYISLS